MGGDILKYHVLPGKTMAADLAASQEVKTVQGQKVTITSDGTTVKFADATVTTPDVETSTGVIHVVDKVVLPPAATTATTTPTSNEGPDELSAAPERYLLPARLMVAAVTLCVLLS